MLISANNLEKALDSYNPGLDRCGNRVFWLQKKYTFDDDFMLAVPITNLYADVIVDWNGADYDYDDGVRFKYTGYVDEYSFKYVCSYNRNWRLFDFPPTKAELAMPWL